MHARALFTVVVLVAFTPGCSYDYPEGVYACTAATEATLCPPGWYCHSDLLCWSRIEMPDAAMPDAGVDAARADAGNVDAAVVFPDGCVLGTYYRDVDGDHHGVTSMTMQACSPPMGYANADGDCNDTDGAIHPGATETCNGVDDDCSGTADDGGTLECVMGMLTSCTTSCGSTGTGLCSPLCLLPTGPSCSPPSAETLCDGLDDDCNGVVDEGLGSVSGPVTGLTHGSTPTSQFLFPRVVPSATGYTLFAPNSDVPSRVFMQALSRAGAPIGAALPIDSRIEASIFAPLSVARVPGGYLIAYGMWNPGTGPTGPITVAALDDTGAVFSFGTLAPPSGYGAWDRVVVVPRSSGSTVSIYASLRSTDSSPFFAIRRYSVDYSGSAPDILAEATVATDVGNDRFDVTSGGGQEWLLYQTPTGELQLVRVYVSVTTAVGTVAHASTPGMGIALAFDEAVSATNPLGIVWQDSPAVPSPTTHFLEISSASPLVMGSELRLPGGSSGMSSRIVPATSPSGAMRSGHWLVVDETRAWEVLGHSGAPTASLWNFPDSIGAGQERSIAIFDGARIAHGTADFDVVSRRLGCR